MKSRRKFIGSSLGLLGIGISNRFVSSDNKPLLPITTIDFGDGYIMPLYTYHTNDPIGVEIDGVVFNRVSLLSAETGDSEYIARVLLYAEEDKRDIIHQLRYGSFHNVSATTIFDVLSFNGIIREMVWSIGDLIDKHESVYKLYLVFNTKHIDCCKSDLPDEIHQELRVRAERVWKRVSKYESSNSL